MSTEQKNRTAAFENNRNGNHTGRDENGVSNPVDCSGGQGKDKTGGKPVHISQKQAQSMPADKDPDDPVSR